MKRPTQLSAGDWFFNITALVAALALVGGLIYVMLTRGAGLFDQTPAATQPPVVTEQGRTVGPVVEAASRTPVGANLQLEAEQRVRSGVYRCLQGGSLVFADQPCPTGREASNPSAASFSSMPQPRSAQGPRSVTAREVTSPAPAASPSNAPDASHVACQEIDADLAQINTRARAGGSATYQDWLRDQRRRLIDEKQRLKC